MHTQVMCYVAGGDLPLDVLWLMEGQQVRVYREEITVTAVGQRSSILSVDTLNAAHTGNYTCLARNSAGADNFTAELVVHGIHNHYKS